jgi:hypothetical protein
MSPMSRPLLLLDVDGPLIPFGGATREYVVRRGSNPPLARINPDLGPLLANLSCELVWATAWMEEANECVGPGLGLPRLPVMAWPDTADDADARIGLHWKTRALVDRAAGRSFIWIDDEIGDMDRLWVSAHHRGPALLHHVDSGVGLSTSDFATLTAWIGAQPDASAGSSDMS